MNEEKKKKVVEMTLEELKELINAIPNDEIISVAFVDKGEIDDDREKVQAN